MHLSRSIRGASARPSVKQWCLVPVSSEVQGPELVGARFLPGRDVTLQSFTPAKLRSSTRLPVTADHSTSHSWIHIFFGTRFPLIPSGQSLLTHAFCLEQFWMNDITWHQQNLMCRQVGPVTEQDFEDLVIRLHEIEVRCVKGDSSDPGQVLARALHPLR